MPKAVAELPGLPEKSAFLSVLRRRLLHRYDDEGWDGLVRRVRALADQAEGLWAEDDRQSFLERFGRALRAGRFLPNSPLLVNCGNAPRRLFACFAVDSRRPLREFLSVVRTIHDGMGGVGYTLEHGTPTHAGEVFVRRVDRDTAAHQHGRPRPASNAVTVSIEAPAADAVWRLSGTMKATCLNVAISDAFMDRASDGDAFAVASLERLGESIHRTGQPGVVFSDRIPRIARDVSAPFAANVCGEAPLAADESGVLGSVNLVRLVRPITGGRFRLDETQLAETVRLGVRFLDGMHDLHEHASEELKRNSLATRKIGIGIMGFAHFLALLGIRYGDAESIAIAERVAMIMSTAARQESARLARLRGPFPAWTERLGVPPRRNAGLIAIAGTSTLALLAGTTGGLEPMYSYVTEQTVLDQTLLVLDPIVGFFGRRNGFSHQEMIQRLSRGESVQRIVGGEVACALPLAHELTGEQHIKVQAAFQRNIDGGISKTLNCSRETSTEDIAGWIRLAHREGCMGLTVYRDRSRASQPIRAAGASKDGLHAYAEGRDSE